ncbi:MAG: hypothetical protein ACR2QJ_16075 [Geminicoccaceae bacterium]
MPREVRRIFFSDSDLHQAVDRYLQANPGKFSEEKLTACQASTGGLEAFFRSRDAARVSSRQTIPRLEAMRILVQFCLDQGIPLPRNAAKTLDLENKTVCLRIELTTSMAHQETTSKLSA